MTHLKRTLRDDSLEEDGSKRFKGTTPGLEKIISPNDGFVMDFVIMCNFPGFISNFGFRNLIALSGTCWDNFEATMKYVEELALINVMGPVYQIQQKRISELVAGGSLCSMKFKVKYYVPSTLKVFQVRDSSISSITRGACSGDFTGLDTLISPKREIEKVNFPIRSRLSPMYYLETESISNFTNGTEFVKIPRDIVSFQTHKDVDLDVETSSELANLKFLGISGFSNFCAVTLPPNIVYFRGAPRYGQDIVFDDLPDSLRELDLKNICRPLYIPGHGGIRAITLSFSGSVIWDNPPYPNLLYLSTTHFSSIRNPSLLPSIQCMVLDFLDFNQAVEFPASLESLHIKRLDTEENGSRIVKFSFPTSVKYLKIGVNGVDGGNISAEAVTHLSLALRNFRIPIPVSDVLTHLRVKSRDRVQISHLPATLEQFVVLAPIAHPLVLPDSVKYLFFGRSDHVYDVNIPSSLLFLDTHTVNLRLDWGSLKRVRSGMRCWKSDNMVFDATVTGRDINLRPFLESQDHEFHDYLHVNSTNLCSNSRLRFCYDTVFPRVLDGHDKLKLELYTFMKNFFLRYQAKELGYETYVQLKNL